MEKYHRLHLLFMISSLNKSIQKYNKLNGLSTLRKNGGGAFLTFPPFRGLFECLLSALYDMPFWGKLKIG